MTVVPSTGDPDLLPYWEGLAAGKLLAQYSPAAGRYRWPPRAACPRTGSGEFTWRALGPTARLFTWTVIENSPLPEFAGHPPYAVGVMEFADSGIRMVGFIDADPAGLIMDMPFAWSIETNGDGEPRVVWRPVV